MYQVHPTNSSCLYVLFADHFEPQAAINTTYFVRLSQFGVQYIPYRKISRNLAHPDLASALLILFAQRFALLVINVSGDKIDFTYRIITTSVLNTLHCAKPSAITHKTSVSAQLSNRLLGKYVCICLDKTPVLHHKAFCCGSWLYNGLGNFLQVSYRATYAYSKRT